MSKPALVWYGQRLVVGGAQCGQRLVVEDATQHEVAALAELVVLALGQRHDRRPRRQSSPLKNGPIDAWSTT